jgi:hypothetical protein
MSASDDRLRELAVRLTAMFREAGDMIDEREWAEYRHVADDEDSESSDFWRGRSDAALDARLLLYHLFLAEGSSGPPMRR